MPPPPENNDESEADAVRRKYLYRRLVINGGVKIPTRLAMKMVGPDCAYHLYRQHMPEKNSGNEERN